MVTSYVEMAGEFEPGDRDCCGDDTGENIVSMNGYTVCCSVPQAQVVCVKDGTCITSGSTDTDGDNMPDVCDSCPTDPDVNTGNCIPKLGGLVTFDDNPNSKVELYAESTTPWTPDSGLFSERSTDSFEGTYSTHNRGSWVRKVISPSQPIIDYKYVKFAYKIPNQEIACLMLKATSIDWLEIADTTVSCSGYLHSANAITLINDGKWHVASVDISDMTGDATWLISGGTGNIYLDNVYLTKETTTYSKATNAIGETPGTKLTVYSVCNDDDGASQIAAGEAYLANLINFQDDSGNPNRGYYYHTASDGVLESTTTTYGVDYTELLTGESSSWSKGDSRIMKAVMRTEGYNNEYGVYSNDISLRCNDAATYNSWDHNVILQTVPANTGIDNNYNTNYKSYDCPYGWAAANTYCSNTVGLKVCKPDNTCGAVERNKLCTETDDCESGLYCSKGFEGNNPSTDWLCCNEETEVADKEEIPTQCTESAVEKAPTICQSPQSWKTNPSQCQRPANPPYTEIACKNDNIEPSGVYYWCSWIVPYGHLAS